jgi:hypothetical protein
MMTTESNLKAAVLELRKMFAEHLPAEDVPGILRKAVENALAEVLGDAPKRPGRPPKSAVSAEVTTRSPKRKGRSPASRRRQAEKMRAYWKSKKAAEAAPKHKRVKAAKAAGDSPDSTQGGT